MRVLVEWMPRLREAMATANALPRPVKALHIFSRHDGQPYTMSGFNSLVQRLQRAWEAAGNERFTIHDMRAKAVTKLRDEGRQAKDITGHKSDQAIDSTYDRRRVRKGSAVE
ncbi:hypothetical protein [Jeongeupia naejangsanensis]|uniref:Tyr recombinase domain-containing protein n=1 Tax=Jeongeupia naejangsanensis TaxID=613195 RepID=A0ABS2BJH1_9NEIS|nr:hypothetical protein [Jeongeupia naejangsanensis]MBM3114979.1 hypothetical protein [Jeongeupia naejangsanensis]